MAKLLTSSRVSKYRRCKRQHHYRYDLRFVPVGVAAYVLRFGTLMHAGLETWWLCAKANLPRDQWLPRAQLAIAEAAMEGELDEFEVARAQEVMLGYHCRWLPEMDHLVCLEVEVEFCMALINPDTGRSSRLFRLAGKIDVIVLDTRDGRVRLMEHKTSTMDISAGSDYWKRLRLDGQVSMYFDGGKSLGHEIHGCIYDVMARPQHRPALATPEENRRYTKGKGCKRCGGSAGGKAGVVPGSGENPDYDGIEPKCTDCDGTGWKEAPRLDSRQRLVDETVEEFRTRIHDAIMTAPTAHYQRGEVVRLDSEMDDHHWEMWATAKALRETELAKRFIRNPDACVMYNKTCDYFDVCTGTASLSDPARFEKVDQVHSELSTEIQQDPKEEGADDSSSENGGEPDF